MASTTGNPAPGEGGFQMTLVLACGLLLASVLALGGGCASMTKPAKHEVLFVVADAHVGRPPPPTPLHVIYGSESAEWSYFKTNPAGSWGTTDAQGMVTLQLEGYRRTITLKVGNSSTRLDPSLLRQGGLVLVPPEAPRYRVRITPRGESN